MIHKIHLAKQPTESLGKLVLSFLGNLKIEKGIGQYQSQWVARTDMVDTFSNCLSPLFTEHDTNHLRQITHATLSNRDEPCPVKLTGK